MTKSGYVSFAGFVDVIESGDTAFNVNLVKPGESTLNGTIYGNGKSPLEGVRVSLRKGWNVKNTAAIQTALTDSNGKYSFDLGDNGAGYYTV